MSATIETLSIPNYTDINITKRLELSADVAAAQAIATFLNNEGISANDYLAFEPGAPTSELLQVQSLGSAGSQQLTMSSNFLMLHRNHAQVFRLFGNQIKVYRAANVDGTIPPDSAFTFMSGIGAVNIDPDQTFSYFTDPSGGVDFWYKFTYYNSYSIAETAISLAVAVRGGGWGSYCSIEEIRNEAGIALTKSLTDADIAARRAEAESEIDGKLSSAGYLLPLQTQAGVPFNPEVVRNIDKILSAGFVLTRNFGTVKPGSSKNGNDKITMAREMLAEIQLNDTVLLDSNKQPLLKEALLDGYPTDDQCTDPTQPGPFFSMDKVF